MTTRHFYLVFAVLCSMFLASCGEKDTPIISELDVAQNTLTFEAKATEAQTVNLTSNLDWTVSIEQSGGWLSVEPASGSGNATLSFTTVASRSPERQAIVSIAAKGAEVKTITVTQSAYKGLFFDFSDIQGWEGAGVIVDNADCSDGKALRIETAANSNERNKLRSMIMCGSGQYTWRFYVPDLGLNDQASIGAFLYADDQHELDFETGSGTAVKRAELNAQADEVLCYATSQGSPKVQQIKTVKKNAWHTCTIDLKLVNEKYLAEWIVDGESFMQRQLDFGEEVMFSIFCSMENLSFLGDHLPSTVSYVLFDYMEYVPYNYSARVFDPNAIDLGPEPEGATTRWDFDGTSAPENWTLASIAGIADGYLTVNTPANSAYNGGLSYGINVGGGKYTWHMSVPQIEEGGKLLSGLSLYYYEGGVERSFSMMVFYGTAADRAAAVPQPTTSQMLLRCYTEAGTWCFPINPNQEYTMTLDLRKLNGKYAVAYMLNGEAVKIVATQHPADTEFGLSLTAMGNGGAWQGSVACAQSYAIKFDYLEYKEYQY
jgi:hypothetical protein